MKDIPARSQSGTIGGKVMYRRLIDVVMGTHRLTPPPSQHHGYPNITDQGQWGSGGVRDVWRTIGTTF